MPSEQQYIGTLTGKVRERFEPLYEEIRLYAPLIGSDGLALYTLLLTYRHRGTLNGSLSRCAWPGERALCAMLGWGRKGGKGSRLGKAFQALVEVGLIEETTIGALLENGHITEEDAAAMVPRTSEAFRRAKRVILVHDPLEEKEFRALWGDKVRDRLTGARPATEQRVGTLQDQDTPGIQVRNDLDTPGIQDMDTSGTQVRNDLDTPGIQDMDTSGTQVKGDMDTPGTHDMDTLRIHTIDVVVFQDQKTTTDVVVFGAGSDAEAEREVVRAWLEEFGIVGPVLNRLEKLPYVMVRGWMIYLESQEHLAPEARQRILVARLRDGHLPPRWSLETARRLPCLTPIQEQVLRKCESNRRRLGVWPDQVLQTVGVEKAERWLAARARNRRELSRRRDDEHPIDFEKYTHGEYADLFGSGRSQSGRREGM